MKTQIIKREEIKIVGIEKRIELTGNQLQELWTKFFEREKEIKNSISEVYYGVASDMAQGEKGPVFNEMVAIEVSDFEAIPDGMSGKTLPSQEYLVFTHRGKLVSENGESLVQQSYQYIYGEFIPNSDYALNGNYNFELYDDRFIYDDNNSEFDIYIPVVQKEKPIKYKLVALDVDGTLLNSKKEIPEENISTIKALTAKGIKFIITTGRPDPQAAQFSEKLGISPVILGNNGATVRNTKSGKLHHATYLPKEKVLELHRKLTSMDVYYRIYGLDSVYTFFSDEFDEEKNEFAYLSKKLAEIMDFKILKNIDELEDNILKFVCFSNDYEKLMAVQSLLSQISQVEVVRGGMNVIDITAANISKGRTLLKYAQTLGIEKDEIVAIGDGENDLEMLKLVGFPITLENGEAILKEIAHMVTVSNDEAGVAKALKKVFSI